MTRRPAARNYAAALHRREHFPRSFSLGAPQLAPPLEGTTLEITGGQLVDAPEIR